MSKYSEEQIIGIPKGARCRAVDGGDPSEVRVSNATFYSTKLRGKFGGMEVSDARS